jgi:hypothetical protein
MKGSGRWQAVKAVASGKYVPRLFLLCSSIVPPRRVTGHWLYPRYPRYHAVVISASRTEWTVRSQGSDSMGLSGAGDA